MLGDPSMARARRRSWDTLLMALVFSAAAVSMLVFPNFWRGRARTSGTVTWRDNLPLTIICAGVAGWLINGYRRERRLSGMTVQDKRVMDLASACRGPLRLSGRGPAEVKVQLRADE